MRRRKALTLARLKDEVRTELRQLARRGTADLAARLDALAARFAPEDEDELFALARHTPDLARARDAGESNRNAVIRTNVLRALRRELEAELAAIASGGPDYLELADRQRGCC